MTPCRARRGHREEFSAAAPPDPEAPGTGETSFADAEAPPAGQLKPGRGGGRGRALPRAGQAHAGRLRELPQADGARERRRRRPRRGQARQGAAAGARPPRAGAQGGRGPRRGDQGLRDGPRRAARRARQVRHPGVLARGRAVRSQRARGDGPAALRGGRAGHRARGLPAGLPRQRRGPAARHGSSSRSSHGPLARLLQDPRRREEGVGGRDQEGVPQARAQVPPGHEQRDRARRSASRRSPRPTTCSPIRRSARSTTAAASSRPRTRSAAAARGRRDRRRLRRLLRHPLGHLQRGRRSRRAHAPRVRARPRPRDDRLALLRAGGRRRAGAGLRRHPLRLPDLPRHRRRARHAAGRLPRLPRSRRGVPGPGPVLDHAPVRALRRLGHRDREAVPHLSRPGPHARAQEVPREHPGGRQGRLAHPPGRQGRGGAARRPAGRPLRRHPRERVAGLPAQGRALRGRGADHGRRGARRRRRRGPDARRHEEAARAAGHEARHGPAPARRGPGGPRRQRARATCATAS